MFVCTHVRSLHFRLDVILLAHHLPILTRQKKKIFYISFFEGIRAGQVKGSLAQPVEGCFIYFTDIEFERVTAVGVIGSLI